MLSFFFFCFPANGASLLTVWFFFLELDHSARSSSWNHTDDAPVQKRVLRSRLSGEDRSYAIRGRTVVPLSWLRRPEPIQQTFEREPAISGFSEWQLTEVNFRKSLASLHGHESTDVLTVDGHRWTRAPKHRLTESHAVFHPQFEEASELAFDA